MQRLLAAGQGIIFPSEDTFPSGEKVVPSISYSWRVLADSSTTKTFETDIWLVVNVPVLSEQMTLVDPSVSTLGRLLTMAFLAAIFRVPSARQVVMTTARPSGIAATANATAILN